MITALVLAAGLGRRFGDESKLLQDIAGRPVVRHAVEAVRVAGIDEIIVVVRPQHDGVRRALEGSGARLVVNPDAASGMGTSLAAGVRSLAAGCAAVLVTLGDIPFIPADAIASLRSSFELRDREIVVPEYRGVRGHPVLFARSVFPELAALTGDEGARSVIARSPARVTAVAVDAPPPLDVDTEEDLARVTSTAHHTSTSTHPSRG